MTLVMHDLILRIYAKISRRQDAIPLKSWRLIDTSKKKKKFIVERYLPRQTPKRLLSIRNRRYYPFIHSHHRIRFSGGQLFSTNVECYSACLVTATKRSCSQGRLCVLPAISNYSSQQSSTHPRCEHCCELCGGRDPTCRTYQGDPVRD